MYQSSSPSLLVPNHQLDDNDADYLLLLLKLRCAIDSSPATFQQLARKVARAPNLNGMSILHACSRFNPSLHVVQILLELLPESPNLVDCMNCTPLHIAAGTRADVCILQLLASASPSTCSIQDLDGMTPLHLACDSTCELFAGDEDCKRDPPTYEVLSTLIRAYPPALTLEDKEEMSA